MEKSQEKKWHFTREWKITYRATSGRNYTDTTHESLEWDEFVITNEIREKVMLFRIIHTDEHELKTDHIEAFKVEKGMITKSLYPEIRNIAVTEEDLKGLGFEGEELLIELGHDF
jgi:hypothetical protein